MNKAKRTAIFELLRADNPAPTTELQYSTPFELLVAVILSAQATDVGVNKATDEAVSRSQYAGSNTRAGGTRPDSVREIHRALQEQGPTYPCHLQDAAG